MTIQLTLTIPSIEVSIRGQAVTGSATVVLPVGTAQLISLLQAMDGTPVVPVPSPAAPVLVVEQPVLSAAEPAPEPEVAPAQEPVSVAPVPERPAPLPTVEIRSRRPGKLSGMTDEELRQAFSDAGNGARAARALGVTPGAIYQHAKRLGFTFPKTTKGGAGTSAPPTFPSMDE
jgi:hypothetical protein